MKISSSLKFIIPSLIFFIMMKFFFESLGLSYLSLLALFLISVFSVFWITKHRFLPIILTMLFTTSSVLFLLTLGKNNFQELYIVCSSLLFTTTLIGLNRFFRQEESLKQEQKQEQEKELKARILDSGFNLNQTIVLISIFLSSSGMYGIYLDFDSPVWLIMLAIFISVFFSTLYLTKINFLKSKALRLHLDSFKNRTFSFYSFLFGFIALELVWVISFLPVNHLTVGAIVLSFYYSFWNILRSYLRNELRRKTVFLNLIFFMGTLIFIFMTSKWDII